MKKNYFMSICLMLFMAVQATAQSFTIDQLFGKWQFTADVEFTDAATQAHKDALSGDCEAVISADETYIAKIVGFAGSSVQQNVNMIGAKNGQDMLKINNLNNPQLWGSLYLANENGDNPYGIWENGTEVVKSYGPVYYNVYATEGLITIPDFTVVALNGYTDKNPTIIAKYTNVKMTLVEAEVVEVADISGEYQFKAGAGTYDTMAGSVIPTEFAVTLAKTSDDNKTYDATIAIEGYDAVTLPASYNGVSVMFDYDNTYLDEANGIRFAPMYGDATAGSIEFKSQDETAFSLYSGFAFASDATVKAADGVTDSLVVNGNYHQWYTSGSLKMATDAPAFDWAGVYTVKTTDENGLYIGDAAGFDWPTEFQIEVEYNEGWDMYIVTKVFGLDVVALNNGGLEFAPSEDGKKVEISTGNLYTVQQGAVYLALRDMNMSTDAIEMVVNEDGTMSVAGLSVVTVISGVETPTLNAFYSNLLVTKEGTEPETPVAPEEFDWAGEYVLTATVDNGNFQSTFDVTIIYDDSYPGYESYCITSFMGYDVTEINYGGIFLNTVDAATQAVDMNYNNLYMLEKGVYLKMLDGNAGNTPIELTLNADATISVSDFTVVHSGTNEQLAKYTNVVLTKKVENVEPETPVVPEEFDWAGEYILTSTVDNGNFQPTFDVTIIYDDSYPGYESYCITSFMGYDVTEINYGGIFLNTVDAATQAVDMNYNNLYMLEKGVYLKMLDGNAGNTPIELTLNADGTISVSDFTVVHSGTNEQLAKYTNVVLTKNNDDTAIEDVVVENNVVKGIFDMQGRKVNAITAPGLYIVDGKKVLVK